MAATLLLQASRQLAAASMPRCLVLFLKAQTHQILMRIVQGRLSQLED